MEAIKKIELILENCEVIDVTNAVGDFSIKNVYTEVNRVASNCIAKTIYAKDIFIQLYKKGEFKYFSFSDDNDLIARLKEYKDITSVEVTYDNYSESYYVDYDEGKDEGKLGAENINQKIYETDNSLFILISATKTFDDFEIEEVDCEWYLEQDVTARIDLKDNGWKEIVNNEKLYEVCLDSDSNKLLVSLNKDFVSLTVYSETVNTISFRPKVFNELLSYLFYNFEIKCSLDQNEFTYIDLDKIIVSEDKKRYHFKLGKHNINIQLTDEENGIVKIDNTYNISIEDILSFMWILLKFIDEDQ